MIADHIILIINQADPIGRGIDVIRDRIDPWNCGDDASLGQVDVIRDRSDVILDQVDVIIYRIDGSVDQDDPSHDQDDVIPDQVDVILGEDDVIFAAFGPAGATKEPVS